ncbi:MAG: transcriptional repressor [Phycisphaeraceae bacterium]|nr:transcriptional repressor [Phycisphaeraceae bacterium]MCB9847420.1 transcriptional repressor [Phycisphaeraceae bacterium]
MSDTRTLFKRKGLRCTRQREAIFETLSMCELHPTAEELFWMVREQRPGLGLSLATVYNTLEALCGATLCRKLPPTRSDAGARYDADLHEHLHLSTEDGRVLDVPDDLGAKLIESVPRALLDSIEQRMGVRIHAVRIGLFGESRRDNADSPG